MRRIRDERRQQHRRRPSAFRKRLEHLMQTAIDSFLRHLRIEKNVAPLTLKSYAEDFESLLAYFRERLGQVPEPGRSHRRHSPRLRQLSARVPVRQDDDRASSRVPADLLSILLPRGRHAQQPGQSTPHAASRPQAAALSDDRADGTAARDASRKQADGTPRPGHPRDDLLGRTASGRSRRRQRRRLGPRRQRGARPRQGTQRARLRRSAATR